MAKKAKPAPEPVVDEVEDTEEASGGRGPTEFHVAMAEWLEETYGGEHSVETVALAQTKRKQFRQSDAYKELISGREAAKAERTAKAAAKAAAAEADEDEDEAEAPAPKAKKGKKSKAATEPEATEAAPEVKAKGKKGKAKAADAEDAPAAKAKGKRKAAF